MEKEKLNNLFKEYICGNISVFKKGLNKLSKFELLEFIEFIQINLNLNAISVCKKYIEDSKGDEI